MVLVTLKDIEAGQHELVLLLDEFVQQLYVIRVTEVISRQAIHIVNKQPLLLLWLWGLRSLHVCSQLLCQSGELVAKFSLTDQF